MKQILFINQINYFLDDTNNKLDTLEKNKNDYNEFDYRNRYNLLMGYKEALNNININIDIETQIMNLINKYNSIQRNITINLINNDDSNYPLFYKTCGALNKLMILLTVSDNFLSCCILNKNIIK